MIKTLTFKTSVFSGDVIYMLAGIKRVCERHGVRAKLYLWLNRPWRDSYEGGAHPYGVNEYALQMMKPLVESQPYIELFDQLRGEEVAVDLDQLRTEKHSTMPHGSISRWAGQIWPDMQGNTSEPWIDTLSMVSEMSPNPQAQGKILINRTSRWRNDHIHYWFLRDIKDQLVFTGLPEEHRAFCKEWELDIPYLEVTDFLDLAVAICSCRYLIGNQSLCFALAEAMKTPRLLEICRFAPNVIPEGPHGYDFMHQFAFEWFVKDTESPLNNL